MGKQKIRRPLLGVKGATFQGDEVTASAGFAEAVETGSTGTELKGYGISAIGSTSGAKIFKLANMPAAGVHKILFATAGSTANTSAVIPATTGITFDGTNRKATFNAAGDALHLVALSTTRWAVVVNTGSVALATT